METPALNGKRRRQKVMEQAGWAEALLRPATLKTVIMCGKWLVSGLKLVLALARIFHE